MKIIRSKILLISILLAVVAGMGCTGKYKLSDTVSYT